MINLGHENYFFLWSHTHLSRCECTNAVLLSSCKRKFSAIFKISFFFVYTKKISRLSNKKFSVFIIRTENRGTPGVMSNESHGKFACVYAQLPNLRNINSIFPHKRKRGKVSQHTSPALFLRSIRIKFRSWHSWECISDDFPTNLHTVLPL